MSGTTLMGKYELYETLGAGGVGTVIRAYYRNLKKDVVIKKLHVEIQDESEKRIEVDILKNLHHQYLPQVFDYFEIDGTGYTVMDFVQGESFGQKLARGERFSERKVLKYAKQLCEVLAYLHSQKLPVIHGDIKPDNVMLTPEDNICLIDFNISGVARGGHAVTFGYTEGYGSPEQYREFQRISALMAAEGPGRTEKLENSAEGPGETQKLEYSTEGPGGTQKQENSAEGPGGTRKLEYSAEKAGRTGSPEMAPGECAVPARQLTEGIAIDKRSDIYSLGATLYHIYSGQVLSRDARNSISAGTSEGFLYILNKALQENPDSRYQDAGQMLAAVNNLYRHDSRYRNMKVRHALAYIVLAGTLVCGVYLVLHGRDVYEGELLRKYDGYIGDMTTARMGKDEAEFEALFGEAAAFMPDRLEAYYQKALFLVEAKRYQDTVNFVRKALDGNGVFYSQDGIGDLYYIMGTAYFELSNYESAANAYANAIKYNEDDPIYYADQAIALARTGNLDAAKEVLGTARAKGALSGSLYLVSGEIKLAEKDYENAEEDFRRSIEETEDDYTRMRAYVMCGKAILGQERSLGAVEKGIALLGEAVDALADEYHAMILEQLTMMYIEGYQMTEDPLYAQGALDALGKIEAAGWATFTTYDNMVNIYYRMGNYTAEAQLLEELGQKYPGNYKVPMKQAFLEVTLQADKPQEDRDYSGFAACYERAQEMYDAVKRDGWSDSEMQVLENAYRELVEGNWLE